MNNDIDTQFLCKDCSRFNQCEYYHKRKEDSYICKYFHLTETYGMTNGDVMQALFPNVVIRNDDSMLIKEVLFSNDMWNSPYKKGGEE